LQANFEKKSRLFSEREIPAPIEPSLPLARIQRRNPAGVLRVEEFQLLLDRSAADELMAWKKNRFDAAGD
jgi:hypothetical protein